MKFRPNALVCGLLLGLLLAPSPATAEGEADPFRSISEKLVCQCSPFLR